MGMNDEVEELVVPFIVRIGGETNDPANPMYWLIIQDGANDDHIALWVPKRLVDPYRHVSQVAGNLVTSLNSLSSLTPKADGDGI